MQVRPNGGWRARVGSPRRIENDASNENEPRDMTARHRDRITRVAIRQVDIHDAPQTINIDREVRSFDVVSATPSSKAESCRSTKPEPIAAIQNRFNVAP